MNSSKLVLGLAWEGGAIGNAEWSGAKLVDVLKFVGVDVDVDVADLKIKHVQFEGADHGADGSPYGEVLSKYH
jgi:sulfite oxidase